MLIRKNDSGRSIVEMLGVLAIMGVITVMGIQGYSQAMGKINRNKVEEDITRIVQEVRGIYAAKTDVYTKVPSGSDTDDLLLSIGFRKSSDRHPFGGVYYITPATEEEGGVKRYFNINITNLNKTDCSFLCYSNWEGTYEDCDVSKACTSDEGNTLTLSFK